MVIKKEYAVLLIQVSVNLKLLQKIVLLNFFKEKECDVGCEFMICVSTGLS